MKHQKIMVGFIMLTAIFFAAACGQDAGSRNAGGEGRQLHTEVTLLLDWYPNANHAGIYWSEEHGY